MAQNEGFTWNILGHQKKYQMTTRAIIEMYAEEFGYSKSTPQKELNSPEPRYLDPTKWDKSKPSPYRLFEMSGGNPELYKELMIGYGHCKAVQQKELVGLDEDTLKQASELAKSLREIKICLDNFNKYNEWRLHGQGVYIAATASFLEEFSEFAAPKARVSKDSIRAEVIKFHGQEIYDSTADEITEAIIKLMEGNK